MTDYDIFCKKCNWNDPELGCTSDYSERIYQCKMYIHYHPKEVEEWEKDCMAWFSKRGTKKGI